MPEQPCDVCNGYGWYTGHDYVCERDGICRCDGVQVQCEACLGTGVIADPDDDPSDTPLKAATCGTMPT